MEQYLEPEQIKMWKRRTQVLYILYGLSLPTLGLTALAAVIYNYLHIHSVARTIFESHFIWQTRTFWWSLFGLITGLVSIFFAVGQFILLVTAAWLLYRVGFGWFRLSKTKPMYGG
jgi:uncharacterized membrane protein